MKSYLVIATVALAAGATIIHWGVRPSAHAALSSTQIYLDGTPVCVMQDGENLIAAVGECARNQAAPRIGEAPGGEDPHSGLGTGGLPWGDAPGGVPGMTLPPGHPPVGPQDGGPGIGPFQGDPGESLALPPGHPPVGPGMPTEQRRLLI